MQIPYLDRRVADLTVLEMQDVWIALEAGEPDGLQLEEIDIANTVGQLTVRQFITAFTHSQPCGLPKG
jgi:hypothetical protein